MSAGDYLLNIGNLTSLGMSDIHGNDATAQSRPGTITFLVDAFGYRILQYCRVFSTVTQGALVSRWGGTNGSTAVTSITSGSVTTAVKSAAWTADTQTGAIFYVSDDAGAAGAAPEGEVSIVSATAAGQLTLEPDLPLTAAIAVNDAVRTISNWQGEASADGDLNQTVLGVVIGKNGITSGNYGWVQREGFTKAKTLASVTVDTPVVADAGVVGPFGSDGQELHVGTALGVVASDSVALTVPVRLNLFTAASVATAP
jgi:hypothetical protein